jgi:hypothetical protein
LQRSLTLLVRYRSRGVLSLGSRCLPCSRGNSNPRYSGADARRTCSRYGAITLFRAPFQETSNERSGDECQSEHHISRRIRFGLCRVHSRLLTTSLHWFLFLPVLRCFSSRRSPLREAIAVGIPIRRSCVLRLRAAPTGLSQLGTSVVGTRAEPSTRRHSSHVRRTYPTNGSSGRLDRTYTRPHLHALVSQGMHRPFPSAVARDGASGWTHWDLNPGPPPCKGGALPLSYGPDGEPRQF